MATLAGFVDHGYLRAEGARALKLDRRQARTNAAAVVQWIKRCSEPGPHPNTVPGGPGARFLRTYWYDGAFDPGDRRRANQERFLAAIAAQEGIQLRLGHIQETKPAWQHALRKALEAVGVEERDFHKHFELRPELRQKGVDTRITLDLVRLAQRRAFDAAVLIAGDRDLAEAVRVAQDEGVLITVATPALNTVARELRELADHLIEIPRDQLATMLEGHLSASKQPAT
jgi:uncharacterized LabA/DUF88 family protein